MSRFFPIFDGGRQKQENWKPLVMPCYKKKHETYPIMGFETGKHAAEKLGLFRHSDIFPHAFKRDRKKKIELRPVTPGKLAILNFRRRWGKVEIWNSHSWVLSTVNKNGLFWMCEQCMSQKTAYFGAACCLHFLKAPPASKLLFFELLKSFWSIFGSSTEKKKVARR